MFRPPLCADRHASKEKRARASLGRTGRREREREYISLGGCRARHFQMQHDPPAGRGMRRAVSVLELHLPAHEHGLYSSCGIDRAETLMTGQLQYFSTSSGSSGLYDLSPTTHHTGPPFLLHPSISTVDLILLSRSAPLMCSQASRGFEFGAGVLDVAPRMNPIGQDRVAVWVQHSQMPSRGDP